MVNNTFNKKVLFYLLNKQHGVKYDDSTFTYKLNIIDDNVNMISLSEKDVLILKEDTYEICSLSPADDLPIVDNINTFMCSSDVDMDTDIGANVGNISDNIKFLDTNSPEINKATKVVDVTFTDTSSSSSSSTNVVVPVDIKTDILDNDTNDYINVKNEASEDESVLYKIFKGVNKIYQKQYKKN